MGDVRAVVKYLARGWSLDSHDQLRQRGFAAAVGTGDGDKGMVFKGQVYISDNLFVFVGIIRYLETEIL